MIASPLTMSSSSSTSSSSTSGSKPASPPLRQFTLIAATMCFLESRNTFMDRDFDKEKEERRFRKYLETSNRAGLRASIQKNIGEFHESFIPEKVNMNRLWECLMVILREDQHRKYDHQHPKYDHHFWVDMEECYDERDRSFVEPVDKINKEFWSKLAATFSDDLRPLAHFKSPVQLQTAYATGKPYTPPPTPVTKHNGKAKAKAKAKKASNKIVRK